MTGGASSRPASGAAQWFWGDRFEPRISRISRIKTEMRIGGPLHLIRAIREIRGSVFRVGDLAAATRPLYLLLRPEFTRPPVLDRHC